MRPFAHLKAFATEVLLSLQVLCLFSEVCYAPVGLMLEHGKCLRAMAFICSIVFSNDGHLYATDLWNLVKEHHQLLLNCYGWELANIKLHWMYHMVQNIHKWAKCIDCFAGERQHKKTIALAMHTCSMGMAYGDYVCKRTLHDLLECYGEELFQPFAFTSSKAKAPIEICTALASQVRYMIPSSVEVGFSARTSRTRVDKDDLVYLGKEAGDHTVGLHRFFASCRCLFEEGPRAFAVFLPLRQVRVGVWGLPHDPNELQICPADAILGTLPCRLEAEGAEVRPLFPWSALV